MNSINLKEFSDRNRKKEIQDSISELNLLVGGNLKSLLNPSNITILILKNIDSEIINHLSNGGKLNIDLLKDGNVCHRLFNVGIEEIRKSYIYDDHGLEYNDINIYPII